MKTLSATGNSNSTRRARAGVVNRTLGWLVLGAVVMFADSLFAGTSVRLALQPRGGSPPVALPVVCTPAPMGLVNWWPGDGNANDIQGGNHGALLAGATFAPGKVGQAFSFDGLDAVVSVPDSAAWDFGSSDFTIDTWVKFFGLSGQEAFVAHNDGGGNQNKWVFWLVGTSLQFHINGSANASISSNAPFVPTLDEWYHVAITRSGTTYKFYVNGAQLGDDQIDANSVPNASAPLTIGKAEALSSLRGFLDEVDISNRALDVSEIQAIYAAGSAGKCRPVCVEPPNMVSWWPGDGHPNDIWGANHGTLMNGATFTSGLVAQAFSFDGADDYVEVPHSPALDITGAITIETWFKMNAVGFGEIVGKGDANCGVGDCSYDVQISDGGSDGKITFVLYGTYPGDRYVTTDNLITPNNWYHLAITWDGTTTNADNVKLYLNGEFIQSWTKTTPLGSNTQSLTIGSKKPPTYYGAMNGQVDELSILNRALSASEIAAIFNAGSAGKCKSAPQLSAALSRKTHGAAGTFDVDLPFTGQPGIECRAAGPGGSHQVVATFPNPVSVGGVSVTSSDGLASATQSVSGGVVTVELSAVSDAQTIAIALLDVNDGIHVGDVVIPMSFLLGDSTGNGSVTASDIGQVKSNSGQPVSASNFRNDINANGSINATDVGVGKASSGHVLP